MPKFALIPGTLRSKPQPKSKPKSTPREALVTVIEPLELPIGKISVFEYLYRDGGNFKSWGWLVLSGVATEAEVAMVKSCIESNAYFIAEQVDIPALYEELWQYSNGPTEEDHVLHEFHSLRAVTDQEPSDNVEIFASTKIFDPVENFISKFRAVKTWDYSLSSHYF